MGIEPTFAAWEAAVLPMNYIRVAALPGSHRGTAPRTASVYLRATLGRWEITTCGVRAAGERNRS